MEPPNAPSRRPSSSSLPAMMPGVAHEPTSTLASLYVVSGLPKSPHTWMLADSEGTIGLAHSQGAVGRFWRSEVLGSTVSPGIGPPPPPSTGGRGKRSQKEKRAPGVGAPSKQETAKLLSKALKARPFLTLFHVLTRCSSRSRAKSRSLRPRSSRSRRSTTSPSPCPRPTRAARTSPRACATAPSVAPRQPLTTGSPPR